MITSYGISKAMFHHFTRVLAVETSMTKTPIEVLGIMIGQVKTTGQGGDHTSFTVLSPKKLVDSILARVDCAYDVVCGNWRHCVTAGDG